MLAVARPPTLQGRTKRPPTKEEQMKNYIPTIEELRGKSARELSVIFRNASMIAADIEYAFFEVTVAAPGPS
jgi:hypothetical protein